MGEKFEEQNGIKGYSHSPPRCECGRRKEHRAAFNDWVCYPCVGRLADILSQSAGDKLEVRPRDW